MDATSHSYTLDYLLGKEKIEIPTRRKWNNYIEILAATEHNLKAINVKFPLNVFTVVTGVSGSGKSSLVHDVFYNALKRFYESATEKPGSFGNLRGSMHLAHHVEFVDQNPIGRSSRSNPVTYVKAYDEIRKLFAEQQLAGEYIAINSGRRLHHNNVRYNKVSIYVAHHIQRSGC